MTIEFGRIRGITARHLIRALQRDGFEFARQKGSHRHYRHPDGRRVTVSYHHSSGTFPMGTLRSMIETQAKWTEDDLKRLGLLD